MKKVFRIILWVVLAAIVIWTFVFLFQKSQKKPVEFQTEAPIITTIIKKTVATGSVVPRREIAIKSKVSGIIEEMYVEAGDVVKKGDLIARVRIIPDMVSLNNAESRLERAEIALQQAKMDYDRNKALYDKGVISLTEFQAYELSYNQAIQERNAAQNNLDLIREGVTKKSGNATNTLIRSTLDGMVLDVPVKEGNSVIEANTFNEGTTISSVADMGEMIFEGTLDESEVGKIKAGMNLILTIGAVETEKFAAQLEYISPKGKEENGTVQFAIRAAVQLQDSVFIRAGYSANADIVLDRRDSVLAISERLLQFAGDTAYVEIETEPQVYERRDVKLGLSDGINIEVLDGITKEDKIKVPVFAGLEKPPMH